MPYDAGLWRGLCYRIGLQGVAQRLFWAAWLPLQLLLPQPALTPRLQTGSVPYWNAYVGATEMHGAGTFFDARFNDKDQYPVAAKSGAGNTRGTPDRLTSKLAAVHFYQLSIPAPKASSGSYDTAAFERGKTLFSGPAKCATCHVPPLFTEPGNNLHAPAELGVDSFQADRSPTHMYRTAPLAGLWTHQRAAFITMADLQPCSMS